MLHLIQWMEKLVCYHAYCYNISVQSCMIKLSLIAQSNYPMIVITVTAGGEDFAGGPFSVIFSTGSILPAAVCTSLLTIDNTAVEGDQNFTIFIESAEPSDVISIVTPSMQTAVITDNDGIDTQSILIKFVHV